MMANAARMSGGGGVERARRSCSPLDPLVDRSEAEASQRILDPRGVGAPPQRSANVRVSCGGAFKLTLALQLKQKPPSVSPAG